MQTVLVMQVVNVWRIMPYCATNHNVRGRVKFNEVFVIFTVTGDPAVQVDFIYSI